MAIKPDPRLNASLIREGRMIFQQLQQIFGNREPRSTSYNDVLIERERAKARAAQPPLICAHCFIDRKPDVPGITIIDGDLLCFAHADGHRSAPRP